MATLKEKVKESFGDDVIESQKEKWWFFVKWYCNTDEKSKESWENSGEYQSTGKISYSGVQEWLLDENLQNGLKTYIKQQRNKKLLDIYEKMYNKALDGDVRCADWVNNFYKSDFFGDDEDDLQRLLKGVEINEN